jgi:hypothetical protein
MADYARRGDSARTQSSHGRQLRRLRTKRPLAGHVPSPTWVMEGAIDGDRVFPPAPVLIDPGGDGVYPEFKQIIAFDGWLSTGEVGIDWFDNATQIGSTHTITAGGVDNRLVLADPWIVDGVVNSWIRPVIAAVTGSPLHLSCVYIIETVPT